MAITLASETNGSGTGDVSGNYSVTKPATVNNDNYLVVIIGKNDDPDMTPPLGWSTGAEAADVVASPDLFAAIYYKKVIDAASEPSSYTFTADASQDYAYWIGSLTGIDLTTPEDETMAGNWAIRINDSTPVASSISTVTAGAYVLAAWYSTDTTVTQAGTPWETRVDNVGSPSMNVVSQIFASAGATGDVNPTDVGSLDDTFAGQFAFRPAGGAAVAITPRRMLVGVGT